MTTASDLTDLKKQAAKVVRRLKADYPEAECALHFDSPFQLLIATILSAQCTDERVNMVTKVLFEKYPTAAEMAPVSQEEMEEIIKSTGFFHNKAKNILACCQQLVDEHDGQVPQELAQLVELAGVGRKTANVVLGTAFQVASGVVVDTHVGRISVRVGLATTREAIKAERELMAILPKTQWINYSHRMIHHGRQICKARKPLCDECSMKRFCPKIDVANEG